MNKNEFMRKLKDGLVGVNQTDKREILLDYEEHFMDGIKLGRTEEEICESLGDPAEIAANLKSESGKASYTANDGVNTAAYIIGIIALSVGCLWLIGVAFNTLGALFASIIGIVAVLALPFVLAIKVTAVSALVFVIALSIMIGFGLVMLTVLILRWFKQMINGLTHDDDKKITREYKMFKVKGSIWATLSIIAVLAFGGIIYGALSVGTDAAQAVLSGDYNKYIDNIEDLENIHDEEDFLAFIEDNEDFPLDIVFDKSKINGGDFSFVTLFGWKKSLDETEALDLSGIETIIVSARSAGIEVVSGSEAKAQLSGRSRYGTEKLEVSKIGTTLEIKVVPAFGPFSSGWINLDVTLPDKVYNTLTVNNSSGSIDVEGIKATTLDIECASGSIAIDGEGYGYSQVSVENSSGRISVEDITDAYIVDVENTSGSILLNNVSCDYMKVKNTSGRIEGQMLEGDMEISNTSGTISLYGDLGDGDSTVRCTSGRIELSLKEEPMDISVSTASGSVNVADSEQFVVTRDSRSVFAGEYSDVSADTPSIEVDSTSGNVDVMFH